ncbi:MAG TPA: GNAT family N-acetyltransferase [Streptosporangiaceae bacterium]|jgi:predicted acetyltransferase|nr:GNAT family N-acetyltransferase [Streptosporangiaceae bacterium]
MATRYPLRPLTEDELPGLLGVHGHAFHTGPPSAASLARLHARLELDRTLGAFDGGTMVGGAGAYSFRMRVPGALAAVAGVTMVGVLPTYRRRGILSSLMWQQLADLHDHGEAVAALFASEAGIYQRYGYGRASWHASYDVRGGEGALAPGAPTDGALRLRITDPEPARAELAKVYEAVLAERPGLYARNDAWWDRLLTDEPEDRAGASPLRCVIAEDPAGPRGYALFSGYSRWDEATFLPDSSVSIREVMTADPAATAAIWADLLSRDLATEFRAPLRPVDDPLLHLLADPRRLRPTVADGLWVRLVDVPAALGQRRYACPVDAVIEVTDGRCGWNQGRWRLTAGGPGGRPAGFAATCGPTSAAADVALPVSTLGAAYLGGTRLGPLAAAGQATELRPGALAALSAAMSWDPAPWCPQIF